MEQLDKSDENEYQIKNNINHFVPLFKSDDYEGTKHRKKPNTPTILLSEEEKGRKIKEVKIRVMKKMKTTRKEDNIKVV